MKIAKYIVLIALLAMVIIPDVNMVQAASPQFIAPQYNDNGSTFLTFIDGQLEFILMQDWKLEKRSEYEYMIKREVNGEEREIGGIEVLVRGRTGSSSKMFRTLRDSGGSYILIEDKLVQKKGHSQYHIKWIKDKRYYVDIYIINDNGRSYHVILHTDLKEFGLNYRDFESFITTLGIKDSAVAGNWKGYYNNVDKYLVYIPEEWYVDNSKEFAVTTIYKPGTGKLYIYKQPLEGEEIEDYLSYNNEGIFSGYTGMELIYKRDEVQEGERIVDYIWRRDTVKSLYRDMNYYWERDIIPANKKYAYTFIMKATRESIEEAFGTFKMILEYFEEADYNLPAKKDGGYLAGNGYEVTVKGKEMKLSIPKDKTLLGIFTGHVLGDYLDALKEVEKQAGHRFELVNGYYNLGSEFPEEDVREIYSDGRIMMLTIFPCSYHNLSNVTISQIVNGGYDHHIRRWAKKVKEIEEPVFINFASGMNADWAPWNARAYGKDHDLFIEAWKRVYGIFKEEGAYNAYFVWNPHDRSYPDYKWNDPNLYYPGDQYVDWIGITGYDKGTRHEKWQVEEFDKLCSDVYTMYRKFYRDKPVMITELTLDASYNERDQQLNAVFQHLGTKYPEVKIAVWRNNIYGRWTYPIHSSPWNKENFKETFRLNRFKFKAIR